MQELINFKDQNLNLDYLTLNIPNPVGRISEFAETFFRYGFNSKVFYVATNESQTILEDKKLNYFLRTHFNKPQKHLVTSYLQEYFLSQDISENLQFYRFIIIYILC